MNMKRFYQSTFSVLPTVILLTLFSSLLAEEDSPYTKELKAVLLDGDEGSSFVPALQYELGYKYEISRYTELTRYFRVNSEGTVATDKDVNAENLFAELELGLNREFTKAAIGPQFTSQPINEGGGMSFGGDQPVSERRHYGNVDLSATVRFETDQAFDNYNLTFGPRIGYIYRNGHAWEDAIPNLQLGYSRVEVLRSEAFEDEGIDEDAFWRFDGVADWTFHVGEWIDPKSSSWPSGLKLMAKVQYSKGHHLPGGATATDLDEAFYYSGTVYYRFNPELGIAKRISAAYLTVGHGRIAPQPEDQTQVFLGVVLAFD